MKKKTFSKELMGTEIKIKTFNTKILKLYDLFFVIFFYFLFESVQFFKSGW